MAPQDYLPLFTSIAAFFLSLYAIIYSRRKDSYQALGDKTSIYFSPEMQLAISRLWNLYRENGKEKFVEKYFEILVQESAQLNQCELSDQIEGQRSTLHYQRRFVTSFWRGLAILIQQKLILRKAVYRFWNQDDLEIIEKVLLPIEDELANRLDTGKLIPRTEPLHFLLKMKRKFNPIIK